MAEFEIVIGTAATAIGPNVTVTVCSGLCCPTFVAPKDRKLLLAEILAPRIGAPAANTVARRNTARLSHLIVIS
jgi:hypothetical protein